MLAGEIYSAIDRELLDELNAVKEIISRFNLLKPSDVFEKRNVLKNLLGSVADDEIIINQPFYCDYGKNIRVGKRFFANFNFTVLDEAIVTIGEFALLFAMVFWDSRLWWIYLLVLGAILIATASVNEYKRRKALESGMEDKKIRLFDDWTW